MEDLYTGSGEVFVKETGLIPRGTHIHSTAASRNLPNIVADMHKMKFDSKHNIEDREIESRDQEIARLNSEVERCSEQVYQVMRMNTNWQRYNDQREAKDQEKEQERAIMVRQIKMLKEHIAMSEQKIMDMKSVYKSDDSAVRAEIAALRKQLETRDAEIQRLKGTNQSEESKTMIEFLRQQVNVYVDDFRKERQDREAVQAKFDTTRLELLEAQKTIERLTRLNKREELPYPYGNWEKPARSFEVGGMRPRGVDYQQRQPTDRYNGSGLSDDVEIDHAADVRSAQKDDLMCPACFKNFSFKDHHLLVEHMDKCS